MASTDSCVLCSITVDSEWNPNNTYSCESCGIYTITKAAHKLYFQNVTNRRNGFGDRTQANLRNWIYRRSTLMVGDDDKLLNITLDLVRKAQEAQLPDATTILTRLIEFIGDWQKGFIGKSVEIEQSKIQLMLSGLGVSDYNDVFFILSTSVEEGFTETPAKDYYKLTMKGWGKYHEDKQTVRNSKQVFMAMPFGVCEVDTIYKECFRDAVSATGFQLFKVDEEPKAGSINNKMIVDIRNRRFLIADLTGENAGSYWEAGFAQGLGLPVIYTCEKGYWDKNKGTHFDTKSFQTVIWESGKEGHKQAAENLKNVIRATLPTEAIMEDSDNS